MRDGLIWTRFCIGCEMSIVMNIQEQQDISLMTIGQILRMRGLLSEADLEKGLLVQNEIGGLLGQALHRIGAVTEEDLLHCLSEQLCLPILTMSDVPGERTEFLRAAQTFDLPASWFLERRVAIWLKKSIVLNEVEAAHSFDRPQKVVGSDREILCVVAGDPLALDLREMMEVVIARSGLDIEPHIVYYLSDNQTIDLCVSYYKDLQDGNDDEFGDASRLRELAEEAPIIDYVNNMFSRAIKESASDVHIEGGSTNSVVRYRIDGVMHERAQMGQSHFDAVASRIKLIGGMDIAERRLPQDGRCTVRFAGNEVDLRISSVPSTWGESIVIRLLRKQQELPNLKGLGLVGRTGEVLNRVLGLPNGVFLVTGPTGSGKSTTLYRGLETINDGQRKIITIEDPVEYDVDSITQIQVKSEIGYDFASGLRAILRQDPDVIMVGEIRDAETATIAAQAALTGHLVLSTLHTNSALAAITRLRDIGLESYLIASSVRGLMAQRLVRQLCQSCHRSIDDPQADQALIKAENEMQEMGLIEDRAPQWRAPQGCDECGDTGYKGRIALSEIIEIDDAMREAITTEAPAGTLFEIARAQGFLTLYEDGLMKARRGETTLAEVLRVCSGDYI